MDWKNLSWAAAGALAFLVLMFVTLVIPNIPVIVTSAFASASVTAAILALRDR